MEPRIWGKTHCPICEKPLAQDEDYDNYLPEDGEHLCWDRPFCCTIATVEDRLIQVLTELDKLKAKKGGLYD